jgi:hypothetical protein
MLHAVGWGTKPDGSIVPALVQSDCRCPPILLFSALSCSSIVAQRCNDSSFSREYSIEKLVSRRSPEGLTGVYPINPPKKATPCHTFSKLICV